MWRSGRCGLGENPGDMWVNCHDMVFVHVRLSVLAVAGLPDKAVLAVSVYGERSAGVDRDVVVIRVLAFSMHEGPG